MDSEWQAFLFTVRESYRGYNEYQGSNTYSISYRIRCGGVDFNCGGAVNYELIAKINSLVLQAEWSKNVGMNLRAHLLMVRANHLINHGLDS